MIQCCLISWWIWIILLLKISRFICVQDVVYETFWCSIKGETFYRFWKTLNIFFVVWGDAYNIEIWIDNYEFDIWWWSLVVASPAAKIEDKRDHTLPPRYRRRASNILNIDKKSRKDFEIFLRLDYSFFKKFCLLVRQLRKNSQSKHRENILLFFSFMYALQNVLTKVSICFVYLTLRMRKLLW